MHNSTPPATATTIAQRIITAARKTAIPRTDTLAVIRCITGRGPDTRINGHRAALAAVAGANLAAAGDVDTVIAEVDRLY